jgi:hypothetical protein
MASWVGEEREGNGAETENSLDGVSWLSSSLAWGVAAVEKKCQILLGVRSRASLSYSKLISLYVVDWITGTLWDPLVPGCFLPIAICPRQSYQRIVSYANGRFSVAVAYFHVQHTHRTIQIQALFFHVSVDLLKILGKRMMICELL